MYKKEVVVLNEHIDSIRVSVQRFFPGNPATEIIDRGFKVKHVFEVVLEDGTRLIYKVKTNPDMGDIWHEANVVRMFKNLNISSPEVLVEDESCSIISFPYLVQEKVGGHKLGDLLITASENEIKMMYEAVGKLYKVMHNVKNEKSGLWGKDPYRPLYPIEPTDYMFNAELINGSGKQAVDQGIISPEVYNAILSVWEENSTYLKTYTPSMIHVSPFLWNIYLEQAGDWRISKLMSMGDVLWWDPAYDIATLKYPPFGSYNETYWTSFLNGYGDEPDEKRILLYAIMHRLCATMGTYMEPERYRDDIWDKACASTIAEYIKRIRAL
jgi:Phosphotransferase enzyme family.